MGQFTSMSNALIDRMFLNPEENQEDALARYENVPPELRDQVRDQHVAQQEATDQATVQETLARLRAIQSLLREEIPTLNPIQKGDLVAFVTDRGKVKRGLVAHMLGLSYSTAGVYKLAAVNNPRCGSHGRCEGIVGCAHERGEALLKNLIRRVRAKLPECLR